MKERLSDVLKQAVRTGLSNVHTCIPAKVVEFDSDEAKIRARPLIRRRRADGNVVDLPDAHEVPVQYPSTAAACITYPLHADDTGILIFAERNIERWLDRGGISDPPSSRRFDFTDAIFIPGVWPFDDAPEIIDDAMLVKYEDSRIELRSDKVVINGHLEVDA